MTPYEDRQTADGLRAADYFTDDEHSAELAVMKARQSALDLRDILVKSPDVIGHYRAVIGEIGSDLLDVAANAPRLT